MIWLRRRWSSIGAIVHAVVLLATACTTLASIDQHAKCRRGLDKLATSLQQHCLGVCFAQMLVCKSSSSTLPINKFGERVNYCCKRLGAGLILNRGPVNWGMPSIQGPRGIHN